MPYIARSGTVDLVRRPKKYGVSALKTETHRLHSPITARKHRSKLKKHGIPTARSASLSVRPYCQFSLIFLSVLEALIQSTLHAKESPNPSVCARFRALRRSI